MKFQISVAIVGIVVLVFAVLPARSNFQIEQCRGVDIVKDEDNLMNVKECLKGVNATAFHEVPAEKMACFGKCVMMKEGIIDDKGLPHKENILKIVKEKMPTGVHDDLVKRMKICLDEETSMIDPTDESCNTYVPLGLCMHLAFLEECETA